MASDARPLTIPAEQLWTVREVASFLQLGRNAIYEMAERGDIPSLRIGSRVRFVPAEVRAWVEQRRAVTPAAAVLPMARKP
jgi:excisionase family DNA binding protein